MVLLGSSDFLQTSDDQTSPDSQKAFLIIPSSLNHRGFSSMSWAFQIIEAKAVILLFIAN